MTMGDCPWRLVTVTKQTTRVLLDGAVRMERKIFLKHENMADSLIKEALKIQNTMVLAVNSDEETIGYVLYRRNGSVGYIDKIAVAEQQRQQGVGRALLQHALAHLRAQRAESVCLYVEAERKVARHLYESAGFTIQAHRPDYYRPGRDAYVMSLTWI